MTTKTSEKLNVNLLVPFTPTAASKIKGIALANGVPVTMITRLLLDRAMQSIEQGNPLTLRLSVPVEGN